MTASDNLVDGAELEINGFIDTRLEKLKADINAIPPPPPPPAPPAAPAEYDYSLPAPKSITTVSTLTGLSTTVMNAASDDWVVLNADILDIPGLIQFKNTAGKRVVIIAYKTGVSVLKGQPIALGSPNLILSGFDIQLSASGDYITMSAPGCRLTRNRIHPANIGEQKWVKLVANDCMLDHNEIFNKTTIDDMILVGGSKVVQGCKIHRNYLHDMTGSDTKNEMIRIGESGVMTSDFYCDVAENRFENHSADTELITVKSCKNALRGNTIVNCKSAFVLRHGHDNVIMNNYFKNAGMRVYGANQTIIGNQVVENSNSQLSGHLTIGTGDQLNDVVGTASYSQFRGGVIQNNMFIGNDATSNTLLYLGYDDRAYKPGGNIFKDNIITASKGILAKAFNGSSWNNNTPVGNVGSVTGSAAIGDMPFTFMTDPKLLMDSDGVYHFTPSSPLKWAENIRYLKPTDVGIFAP